MCSLLLKVWHLVPSCLVLYCPIEDILKTPLNYQNFELEIPKGPGLGIELDENKIDNLRRQ